MNREAFQWAVFCAVLAPLFLRQPADPMWFTAVQVAICFIMVALADRIERRA